MWLACKMRQERWGIKVIQTWYRYSYPFIYPLKFTKGLFMIRKGSVISGLTALLWFLLNVDPNKNWKTILFIYCLLSIKSQNYKMQIPNWSFEPKFCLSLVYKFSMTIFFSLCILQYHLIDEKKTWVTFDRCQIINW